jgi:hypothetical protein
MEVRWLVGGRAVAGVVRAAGQEETLPDDLGAALVAQGLVVAIDPVTADPLPPPAAAAEA